MDAIICVIRKPERFGFVADILPAGTFEGAEVLKMKKTFVRVMVSDLDEDLADDLKAGIKKFKVPSINSQLYKDLDNQGYTAVTNAELLGFIEDA